MQGFKITDPIDNIVVTRKYNYFAKKDEIAHRFSVNETPHPPCPDRPPFTRHRGDRPHILRKLDKVNHIAYLLDGIYYSDYNEQFYYILNNSNFDIGLTNDGYYKVMIPVDEPWKFVNSPYNSPDYGKFKAVYLGSRWKF